MWGPSKAFSPSHFVLWIVLFVVQLSGFCEALNIAAVLLFFSGSCVFGAKSLIDYAVNVARISCIMGAYGSTQCQKDNIEFFSWKAGQVLEWRVENLYENQRWWAGLGWATEMLHEDPGSWSNEAGTLSMPSAIAYEQLTNWKHVLCQGWNVGKTILARPEFTRLDNWTYAPSFRGPFSADSNILSSVRRRRWRGIFLVRVENAEVSEFCKILGNTALGREVL